ncbi:hypothetical protein ACA910_017925 [Epithemia clementina (nom. ined.)]
MSTNLKPQSVGQNSGSSSTTTTIRSSPSSSSSEDAIPLLPMENRTDANPYLIVHGGLAPLYGPLSPLVNDNDNEHDLLLDTLLVSKQESSPWPYWSTAVELTHAGTVGATTGFLVAIFKLTIEAVRSFCYEQDVWGDHPTLLFIVPLVGGVVVGLISWLGGPFPPGLRGTLQQVDDEEQNRNNKPNGESKILDQSTIQGNFARKSTAAVATLGTGCSLGPEGPCVELGMNVAHSSLLFVKNRSLLSPVQQPSQNPEWHRILLSSGAAAGVAAGFNAPIAGVFFTLEIMQNAFQSIDRQQQQQQNNGKAAAENGNEDGSMSQPSFSSATTTTTNPSITPILMASVLSALVGQSMLGNHLIFKISQGLAVQTSLVELPLFILLGVMSGLVAFLFTYTAKVSKSFFEGDWGPDRLKEIMTSIPTPAKPALGGLFCGLVALVYPQVLFLGYETLDPLLKSQAYLPTIDIVSLLGVKTLVTAVCAGSGLVGGTFAPSLVLGFMTGAVFRDGAAGLIKSFNGVDPMVDGSSALDGASVVVDGAGALAASTIRIVPNLFQMTLHLQDLHLSSVPVYTMVGAASVLAALFRAPLTSTLLLFEVTRNYDVLLPIMASAGVASIVGDILEDTLERKDEMQRRDLDPVSWGDLAGIPGMSSRFAVFRPVLQARHDDRHL